MMTSKDFKKSFIGSIAVGSVVATATVTALYWHHRNRILKPNRTLEKIKKEFSKTYSVTGSWIEMKPTLYKESENVQTVYYGGLSLLEENKHVQYEFIANAKSGAVVDWYVL